MRSDAPPEVETSENQELAGAEHGEAPAAEPEALRLLAEERAKNKELLTRLAYVQADFENYRKRVDREASASRDASLGGLVSRLLSVLDELDLAIAGTESGTGHTSLLEGIEMIQKNLRSALEKEGLKKIEAVGKPFDPAYHEAVEKTQGDETGDDVVVEEIRPGYVFRGLVLRPSMVKVKMAFKEGGVAKN